MFFFGHYTNSFSRMLVFAEVLFNFVFRNKIALSSKFLEFRQFDDKLCFDFSGDKFLFYISASIRNTLAQSRVPMKTCTTITVVEK